MNVLSEKEKLEIEILQLQKKKLEAELAALNGSNVPEGTKSAVKDLVACYFEQGFNSAQSVVLYLEGLVASKCFQSDKLAMEAGLLKANLIYAESLFGEWLACEAYEKENGIY